VGLPNSTDYFNAKCVRTTNSGVSFATLSQAVAGAIWQDIAIDANGRWWGLTNTSAGRVRIYYSDDQGDNWTLSYDNTTAGQRPCKIVCHPSDPQRITALGGGSTPSTTFVTIVTVDRGVTWNRNQASAITSADQGHEIDVLMLPNYRLVIVGVKQNSTTNRQIMTSDDNGQTWQFRYNASTDRLLGPVGGVNGVKMFAVRVISGNDSILMSTDQGGTWVALTPTVPAAAATDLKGGIAYDEREDALYGLSQGGSSNEKIVTRLSPALDQSFWNDFSDRAIPVGAYTSLSVADYARQIAIVPGS